MIIAGYPKLGAFYMKLYGKDLDDKNINFSVEKILIFRLGSLGDTIIALPCFHFIRNTFPQNDITLLTNKPIMSKAASIEVILDKGGFFDNVIYYPIGTRNIKLLLKLILKIRSKKINTVINITATRSKFSTLRDKLFFRVAGVKNLIGFPEKEDFNLLTDHKTGVCEWEAKRLAKRIRKLGKVPLDFENSWNLNLNRDEIEVASRLLVELKPAAPLLAISTGTKCQSNDWGINNWIKVLGELSVMLPNWQLIVLGASEDEMTAQTCLKAWGNGGLSLCGKSMPRVSAAVLKQVNLFIGHDSGPIHLAACVGTPCVGIYSARNLPGQWFPRGRRNAIIYHQVECAGCGLEVCIEQKKKCILSISIEEVKQAVVKIINTQILGEPKHQR